MAHFRPDSGIHSPGTFGVSVKTARAYLKGVKAKYQQAGLPAYTKEDLAERVRADWQ